MERRAAVLAFCILVILLLAFAPAWAGSVRTGAQAEGLVRGLLQHRTPPLRIGTVREAGQVYEAEVVTPRGTLVDRLLVEKASGRVRSLYGRMLLSLEPSGNQLPAPAPGGS